ncbi:unnamed protein product [Pedinophyceae sp. YPF-701]|nr:unnamed protein product [Pedinophyceae sp. YPF-701]
MGLFASKLLEWFSPTQEHKVVMIGLDNAGKTTILYRLHLGTVVAAYPTIGSNVEQVKVGGLTLQVWDLGGQTSLRESWLHYFKDTHAVVAVVDCADRARIPTAREEIWRVLQSEEGAGVAVLVLANKQDLPDAVSSGDLGRELRLDELRERHWHIQSCCALTGEGLREGMGWLSGRIRAGDGV